MIQGVNTLPVILLAAAGVGFGHAVMPDHWLPLAILSRTRRYRTGTVARLSLAAAVAHVVVSLLLGGVVILVGLQFRATIAGHTDLVTGGILLATGAVFLILDLHGKGHGHAHGRGHDTHSHDAHDEGAQAPCGHDRQHDEHGHGAHHGHGVHHHHNHDDHEHQEHIVHGEGGTAVLDRQATTVLDRRATQTQPQVRGARGLGALLVPFGAAASPDLTILPVFLAASALGAGAALGSLGVFTLVTVVTIVGLTIATALGARLLTAPWIDRSANLLTAGTLLLIGALVVFGLT
jgi:nickel/cobalt transporter (NicO) family protein